jgi:hypothetical protein
MQQLLARLFWCLCLLGLVPLFLVLFGFLFGSVLYFLVLFR